MSYCAVSDVQARLQHVTIGVTTKPTTAQVESWITQVSAAMDALFQSYGVVVPLTDADKLLVLKPICVNAVAAEVLRSVEMESESAAVYQSLYDESMRRIERNPGILKPSATYASPGAPDFSGVTRVFRRESREW